MINKRRMERNIGTILSMGTFTFKKKDMALMQYKKVTEKMSKGRFIMASFYIR